MRPVSCTPLGTYTKVGRISNGQYVCEWSGWFVLNRSATNRNTSKALAALDRSGTRCAPWSRRSLRCLRRPGGTERRSPFQSARSPGDPPAVPGGLKGRGRVREARRRKHRNGVRSAASPGTEAGRGLSRCCGSLQRDSVRTTCTIRTSTSRPIHGVKMKSIPCE